MKYWLGLLKEFICVLAGDLYEWCWRNTLGRPWTYMMREHPWIPALVLVVSLTGLYFFRDYWQLLIWTSGIAIVAHVWWDTAGAYIKYQHDFRDSK